MLVLVLTQVGVLPVVHGSALASQGASQALVTATLGEDTELAKFEGITGDQAKQLMVQLSDRTAAASQVGPPPTLPHPPCLTHPASCCYCHKLWTLSFADIWR